MEESQHLHRVGLEGVVAEHVEAVARGPKAGHVPFPQTEPRQAQHRPPAVLFLERGAQDPGQVADILGDQEIVLHETLDAARAGSVGVVEAARQVRLHVEREPLLGPPGEVVQVAADGPEKAVRLDEAPALGGGQHAAFDQLADLVDAIEVLGEPEQGVQVAQAALAFLQVGLDHVARIAEALVALVALGELALDEVRGALGDDVLLEAGG